MKIERGKIETQRLSSFMEGEVFEYNNAFYLKTDESIDDMRTCVNLKDGKMRWFAEDSFVYRHEAKIIIE